MYGIKSNIFHRYQILLEERRKEQQIAAEKARQKLAEDKHELDVHSSTSDEGILSARGSSNEELDKEEFHDQGHDSEGYISFLVKLYFTDNLIMDMRYMNMIMFKHCKSNNSYKEFWFVNIMSSKRSQWCSNLSCHDIRS